MINDVPLCERVILSMARILGHGWVHSLCNGNTCEKNARQELKIYRRVLQSGTVNEGLTVRYR